MHRFLQYAAAGVASAVIVSLPVQSLARGWGLGFGRGNDQSSEQMEGPMGVPFEGSGQGSIGEFGSRNSEGNRRGFGFGQQGRGMPMMGGRMRSEDARGSQEDQGDQESRGDREGIRMIHHQLVAAFHEQAKALLSPCKEKTTEEARKVCVAEAKVKLQAKVTAAVEALKK